jgi:hypothetical protein
LSALLRLVGKGSGTNGDARDDGLSVVAGLEVCSSARNSESHTVGDVELENSLSSGN